MIRNASLSDMSYILSSEKKYFSFPRMNIDVQDCCVDDLHRGYADMKIVLDEGYIGNVLVEENCRRQGIGDDLINYLILKANSCNLSFVTLEVRTSNDAAINLYKKHGFVIEGVLPNHYSDPNENAYVMTVRKPF